MSRYIGILVALIVLITLIYHFWISGEGITAGLLIIVLIIALYGIVTGKGES